jgi:ATP-dependent Clp protease protease subunit
MTLSDSVYERLLQQRIIVLGQQVDSEISNRIAAQMLLLAAEDADADISLYINSPGGSVPDGMAIFDTMQFIPCDVATYGMGMAASMGQFLLSAGTPGKRYVLPHCQILMHQPSAGVGGTSVRWRSSSPSTPGRRSSGSSPTSTATGGSPRRRRSSTASSTT